MSNNHRGVLFTSESVTEGHPDKISDQISDAILDAALSADPAARVACETLVTTGLVVVAGEITTDAVIDYSRVARETVREIGYTRAKYGFDCDTCAVLSALDRQSPDIAMGVDTGGAGDQGIGRMQCGESFPIELLQILPLVGRCQTRDVAGVLRAHAAGARTLFLSIHQIADAERVCDRFVLLSGGRARGEGTLKELAAVAAARGSSAGDDLEEVFLALT